MFDVESRAARPVWCGISSGNSLEVASTKATSWCCEGTKHLSGAVMPHHGSC